MTGIVRSAARGLAKRRLRKLDKTGPLDILRQLLFDARHTRWGKAHGYEELAQATDCYERYRDRLPIIDYHDWVEWLGDKSPLNNEGPVPLIDEAWPGKIDTFCLSSGTTSGRSKYIPYSKEMATVNRVAALDFFAAMVAKEPTAAPPFTRSLYMSGSTDVTRNHHGSLCGDMSALTKYLAPKVLEMITLPPRSISSLEPWEKRLDALARLCIRTPRIGMISGIPIWQLSLLEAVVEQGGKPLPQILPHLRYIVHGGMSIAPYRQRLKEIAGDAVHFLETYAASETGITAWQFPGEDGMRLWQQYRVFYEFEDDNGQVLLAPELQPGVAYNLIVSSCAGLWRYRIGDKVVFKSIKPLILDYVTRDKTTSAFDEKITEKEIERAISAATPSFADYAMGPDVSNRRHMWFVIGDAFPDQSWMDGVDDFLRANNMDYDDYRGDGRIHGPVCVNEPDRSRFLKQLGKVEGGQRKFPRLLSPDEVAKLKTLYQLEA